MNLLNTFKYPEHLREALLIGRNWSYCGACGKGAYPSQTSHIGEAGYGGKGPDEGGCGIKWKKVSSEYVGAKQEEAVKNMRPDLEFVRYMS